jgi:CcmD family protein
VDYLEFMFAGFAVFWAALFAYLLWLQSTIRGLRREIERLEARLAEEEAAPSPARPASASPAATARGRAAPERPS